jgi:hypothetical protein
VDRASRLLMCMHCCSCRCSRAWARAALSCAPALLFFFKSLPALPRSVRCPCVATASLSGHVTACALPPHTGAALRLSLARRQPASVQTPLRTAPAAPRRRALPRLAFLSFLSASRYSTGLLYSLLLHTRRYISPPAPQLRRCAVPRGSPPSCQCTARRACPPNRSGLLRAAPQRGSLMTCLRAAAVNAIFSCISFI